MIEVRQAGVWFAIVGIALAVQGCWENEEDQLTLLGTGGCRTADGGAGNPASYPGLSYDECKAKCFDGSSPCVAIEFNANNGLCEVHAEPITKFEGVQGVTCHVVR